MIPLVKREGGVTTRKLFRREWQDEAWAYFDDVPEIKYSTWFMGNVMGKCRLFPAVIDPADPDAPPIPATDPDAGLGIAVAQRAQAEIDRLRGPLGGRPEILRSSNMNLEIAGELFIIGFGPREVVIKDPVSEEPIGTELIAEEWGVFSTSQVVEKDGRYTVKMRPDDKDSDRALDPLIDSDPIRIYQRHPRFSLEADCAMRGVLSACEALVLLDNSIKAEAKSRMSGGYLLIPNELSNGPDVETEPEDGEEAPVDAFLQEIYDGAVDPVEDPSSAAAVAPTFVRGPAEALKEFRHLTIARVGDATILPKIAALIERIARGLNLPVEIIMGHQQTTFSNAAQVKQDTFDDHFQPRCALICDALTVGFLRPNLIAAGMDPAIAERLVVWFDPSGMIKEVNPVDSADEGIALDLLSDEAWRRAKGWSEDDAPDPVERLVRAVLHLRTFDKGVSTAILELLGVPLDIPESLPGDTGGDVGAAGQTPPPPVQAVPAAASGLERLLSERIAARYHPADDLEARQSLNDILVDLLFRDPDVIRAAATRVAPPRRNVGHELMLLDRELRTKLLVAATDAMTRAFERAGNKLRAAKGQAQTLARAGFVHPVYVAPMLGPKLIASAGFSDDDLVGGPVWSALEEQWRTWVTATQARALGIIASTITMTSAHRATIAAEQARSLESAWEWFNDQLHALAVHRLYHPDPLEPAVGEFDPSGRVPAALVRQAIARAGGATSISPVAERKPELRAAASDEPVYVAVDDGEPLGGIGTGATLMGALDDAGGGVEGYEWVYGPAMRLHPFDPHLDLDGQPFVNFDDDVLAAGDWIGDFYFPGDHNGCNCDFAPTIVDGSQDAGDGDTAPDTGTSDASWSLTVPAGETIGSPSTADVSPVDEILDENEQRRKKAKP